LRHFLKDLWEIFAGNAKPEKMLKPALPPASASLCMGLFR
jgi:hypothetical protein